MTKKTKLIAVALGGIFVLTAGNAVSGEKPAPETRNNEAPNQNAPQTKEQQNQEPLKGVRRTSIAVMGKSFLAAKASDLIGREIKGKDGAELATVSDLAVDARNGRVVAIVATRGGLLGVGERLRAIPPQSLTYARFVKSGENAENPERQLGLDMSVKQFEKVPVFDWNLKDESTQMLVAYRHFGQSAYWHSEDTVGQKARNPDTESAPPPAAERAKDSGSQETMTQPGLRLAKASQLLDKTVRDNQNAKVGEIENFLIDLNSGHILFAVVSSGGVLGVGETLHAIPPRQIDYGKNLDQATLRLSKNKLDQTTTIKDEEWAELSDPVWVANVYRRFNETVFWSSDARQPVRNRDEQGSTFQKELDKKQEPQNR